MKLLDHFTRSGGFFFRWRSYLPLLLLPAFLLAAADEPSGWSSAGETGWEIGCFVLALSGLAVRIWTIGTAPAGTSERSTRETRAASLNTSGVYSLVRHPLYLGTSIVALGLACFARVWYLPVIVVLASLLYHERIAVREEVFLEERFGEAFRTWAARVPAMVPVPGTHRPAAPGFNWSNVLGREFHGLFTIGSGFFVLDFVQESLARGRPVVFSLWAAVFAATGTVFLAMVVLKRGFGFFRTPGA